MSKFKGDRKRLTLRLSKVIAKRIIASAKGAEMTVNEMIECILRDWSGRIPPVQR